MSNKLSKRRACGFSLLVLGSVFLSPLAPFIFTQWWSWNRVAAPRPAGRTTRLNLHRCLLQVQLLTLRVRHHSIASVSGVAVSDSAVVLRRWRRNWRRFLEREASVGSWWTDRSSCLTGRFFPDYYKLTNMVKETSVICRRQKVLQDGGDDVTSD